MKRLLSGLALTGWMAGFGCGGTPLVGVDNKGGTETANGGSCNHDCQVTIPGGTTIVVIETIDGGVVFIDGGVISPNIPVLVPTPIDGGVQYIDGGVKTIDGGVQVIDGGVQNVDDGGGVVHQDSGTQASTPVDAGQTTPSGPTWQHIGITMQDISTGAKCFNTETALPICDAQRVGHRVIIDGPDAVQLGLPATGNIFRDDQLNPTLWGPDVITEALAMTMTDTTHAVVTFARGCGSGTTSRMLVDTYECE